MPISAEVRLYENLFSKEDPNDVPEGQEFTANLNPNSLETVTDAKLEPSLATAKPGDRYQFERLGYFCVDLDSAPGSSSSIGLCSCGTRGRRSRSERRGSSMDLTEEERQPVACGLLKLPEKEVKNREKSWDNFCAMPSPNSSEKAAIRAILEECQGSR